MNNVPSISIVMPFYNSRFDYFTCALNSILCQSYKNWEVIIVDDGSSNENKIVLEKFIQNLNDNRISIIHLDKNYGPSTAYNKGIEEAKGKLVTWLDSDDFYLPWYCEDIVNYFSCDPDCSILFAPVLFYLNFWKIKKIKISNSFLEVLEGKKEKVSDLLNELKEGKLPFFPLPIFKKEVFEHIKFDQDISFGEDNDLYFQIYNNCNLLNKTKVFQTFGYVYRIYTSKSRLTHRKDLRFKEIKKIIKKYQGDVSLANKSISDLQNHNDLWKFCYLLDEYLQSGSMINYFKNVFSNFKSTKDRIKSVRVLFHTLLDYHILVPVFGIGSRFKNMLFPFGKNKYQKIRNMFLDYLNVISNEEENLKLTRLYKEVF